MGLGQSLLVLSLTCLKGLVIWHEATDGETAKEPVERTVLSETGADGSSMLVAFRRGLKSIYASVTESGAAMLYEKYAKRRLRPRRKGSKREKREPDREWTSLVATCRVGSISKIR